jgi:hypothetical protein
MTARDQWVSSRLPSSSTSAHHSVGTRRRDNLSITTGDHGRIPPALASDATTGSD